MFSFYNVVREDLLARSKPEIPSVINYKVLIKTKIITKQNLNNIQKLALQPPPSPPRD